MPSWGRGLLGVTASGPRTPTGSGVLAASCCGNGWPGPEESISGGSSAEVKSGLTPLGRGQSYTRLASELAWNGRTVHGGQMDSGGRTLLLLPTLSAGHEPWIFS